ncbi:cobalt ABC transporter [Acidipropionibacterium acidipropionici]|uniref:Uncharacterized protein n=1 Tax=Acidipropionibacterium acidipropionici TaxID=1748 RepID=A0ABN4U4M5_9ACTN|nr:hypothetical protein A8L58_08650 [Acidipropionibacterium acidipropionici]AZP37174.1 cobalt ABC transporter [Acidipropionibacterium acidipropionici]QCV94196.1 cobalt ABC transporter [Acidipropionibacterium acidipropionici]
MAVPLTLDADRPDLLEVLVARILDDARGARPVVIIDGGSGSGKTTLANRLVASLDAASGSGWQLVHDDFYPGWTGLSAAWTVVPDQILASRDPGYRMWDWQAGSPGERRVLGPDRPVLVEACGALTPASAALATTTVWLEADSATRKRRALARDGEMFAPWWALWAVQEELHRVRHGPQDLADVRVECGSAPALST